MKRILEPVQRLLIPWLCLAWAIPGCSTEDPAGIGSEVGTAIQCALVSLFQWYPDAIMGEQGVIEARLQECDDATDCRADAPFLRGTQLSLLIPLPLGVDGADVKFESSDPNVMLVEGFEPEYDECKSTYYAEGTVTLRGAGEASLVIRENGRELDRFTWSSFDATAIELSVRDNGADKDRPKAKSYELTNLVEVRARVRNAAGDRLLTGGREEWWLEDPDIVTLYPGYDDVSARGHGHLLFPLHAGTTRLHLLITNLETEAEIVVPEDFVPPQTEQAP